MLSAGTRVRFRFDVGSERRWFAGAVKSYSKKRGHCIAYDNGQVGMQHLDDWSPSDFEILWESSVVLSAGTRVRFRWDVGSERRWFAGVVKSYSKKRGYCIAYDNGQVRTERLDTWSSSDFEVVAAGCAEENVDGGCDGSPSPPHNASHETSIAGASDSGSSHASGAAATDESAIVRSAQRGAKDRGSQLWAQDSSGKWARVRVLREEDGQVLVRFLGWGEDFDEWIQVGAGRLRGSAWTRVGRQLSTAPKPNASGLDGEGCSKCRFTRCSKCHVTGSKRPRSSASEGKLPVGVAAVASGGARKRIRGERGIAADAPSAQPTDDSESAGG